VSTGKRVERAQSEQRVQREDQRISMRTHLEVLSAEREAEQREPTDSAERSPFGPIEKVARTVS
jgi:hypothetical protein